jgi:hypothetical protein
LFCSSSHISNARGRALRRDSFGLLTIIMVLFFQFVGFYIRVVHELSRPNSSELAKRRV